MPVVLNEYSSIRYFNPIGPQRVIPHEPERVWPDGRLPADAGNEQGKE
jgi:hypothetical protein